MTQLRTTVLMKTDIVGSTPRFRALLASDLQAALSAHRTMVAHLAAEEGGRIFKAAGDGYWLEFPSVTSNGKVRDSDARSARIDTVEKGP
jgi:class 3 adenylate cyclase